MWFFGRKNSSKFSGSSTAEEVTHGIDGTGLIAIVTGASSGLGIETTRVLALRGVHVIMAIRNTASGKSIKAKILDEIPNAKIDIMELDLSSMASVRKFASNYKSSYNSLNLLINNAGIFGTPFTLSKDNIELQFATNHLGHFLLVHLLMDTMKNTALESGREGRIVNVSSKGHDYMTRVGIHFDTLNDSKGYFGPNAYSQSKLANILHANELARRFKNDGVQITANSLHPGTIYTNIFRHNRFFDGIFRWLCKYFLKDIHQGAATTCYVALHPDLEGVSGKYFSDCNLAKPSKLAQDVALAQKLWDFSLDLVK